MMDVFLLAAGLALPWFLGMAAIAATRSRDEPFNAETEIAWIAGAGCHRIRCIVEQIRPDLTELRAVRLQRCECTVVLALHARTSRF